VNTKPQFPIPLTILTGFLGAGKTTLLNHILHGEHGLKIAVLVNDFGAVNIDTQLVVGVEGETVSLSNGCICCTIRDDLLVAVIDLLKRPEPPEYILIETSGVSDPASVALTFAMPEVARAIRVDSIVTVIDAEQLRTLDDEYSQLAFAQIAVADIIILNKVDVTPPDVLVQLKDDIGKFIPSARIYETSFANVPLELLLGVGQYEPERVHQRTAKDVHVHGVDEASDHHHDHDHEHHHDHDDHDHDHDHSLVFSTWSWSSDAPLALSKVRDFLETLPKTIYRAKGFLSIAEFAAKRAVVQLVGRRASLRLGEAWAEGETRRNQLVFIASHGGIDAEALRSALDACAVPNESDNAEQGQGVEIIRR
jgi:G3E family GTPase